MTLPQSAHSAPAARLALVGDRSSAVRSHVRVPGLLASLARHEGVVVDPYWVPTEDAELPGALDGFDAVWLLPGSPYRSEAGAIAAVRAAREGGVPFFGTCGGFQHALLEYARSVCGLGDAAHAEVAPEADGPLIAPLACSLVGHEGPVTVVPGTLAARLLGTDRTVERYRCSYALDPAYEDVLRAHGLRFSGADEEGRPRIMELPGHPFFLGTLFQPELAGDGTRAHPLIRALAEAAVRRAAERTAA
ncbi:CTP synthase C-terminal region-related (seleno)protein [Streptomyces sp. CA-181903]|uniref:CTP synthase C-terminal region-related (seleno)protein n=1 Tax=Streptomyces sp. CA-181903 TaxID=3240055 RepID=UPI003D915271